MPQGRSFTQLMEGPGATTNNYTEAICHAEVAATLGELLELAASSDYRADAVLESVGMLLKYHSWQTTAAIHELADEIRPKTQALPLKAKAAKG